MRFMIRLHGTDPIHAHGDDVTTDAVHHLIDCVKRDRHERHSIRSAADYGRDLHFDTWQVKSIEIHP